MRMASRSTITEPGTGIIRCFAVRKTLGRHQVLNGVSCAFPEGKISALMGPSGAGKSVLLRHLVGLLMPDAGDVVVDGRHVARLGQQELQELRRTMGLLFGDGPLVGSMSIFDNVAFPLRQHTRKSEREIRKVVLLRLGEVGLEGAAESMPNELHIAMRRRAAFARALVLGPKILLFDEPDSGLDQARTALLCSLIREVQRRHRATAVLISQDTRAGFEVADHVVLMHRGRVVEQGSKDELRASTVEFTRQFFRRAVEGQPSMG